jgi:hypothetical protein
MGRRKSCGFAEIVLWGMMRMIGLYFLGVLTTCLGLVTLVVAGCIFWCSNFLLHMLKVETLLFYVPISCMPFIAVWWWREDVRDVEQQRLNQIALEQEIRISTMD